MIKAQVGTWHKSCRIHDVLPAYHSLHYRVHTRVLLTLAVVLLLTAVALAEPEHRVLLREAAAAQKAGDTALFVAKLESARKLCPDYPRGLLLLARGYSALNRPDDAVATLHTVAAMGLTYPIELDKTFAALHMQRQYPDLVKAFAANAVPHGTGQSAFQIPDCDGIVEGVACDGQGNWYFSDVRNRCLWRRDAAGNLTCFSRDADALLGIFGLKVDEKRGALWAGTSALPEMRGYIPADNDRAALVEFDLTDGRVRHSYPVPADGREHVLGDVLVGSDGTIYASDSGPPIIWRLKPGATQLEKWLECDQCVNLQGMIESPDHRSLIFADYLSGLWRADFDSKAVEHFSPLPNQTLLGLDGLYAIPGGLIATQSGSQPLRVVRLTLDGTGRPTSLQVLESGHPKLNDLSLGTVVGDEFYFIGNSGWALFEKPETTPARRPVTVFKTKI